MPLSLEEHQVMTIELDLALDRLRGNFANILWLEIFKTWMSYEPEMYRLFHQVYQNLLKYQQDKALSAFHFRTEAWIYFCSMVNTRPNELWDKPWEEAIPSGSRRNHFVSVADQ